MNRAAGHYGISREFEAAQICQQFRKLTLEIFPHAEAKDYIQPAHFKKNELTIYVENAAWGQEVIIRKPKIIAEMNARLGKQTIKDLKTRIKRQAS